MALRIDCLYRLQMLIELRFSRRSSNFFSSGYWNNLCILSSMIEAIGMWELGNNACTPLISPFCLSERKTRLSSIR